MTNAIYKDWFLGLHSDKKSSLSAFPLSSVPANGFGHAHQGSNVF